MLWRVFPFIFGIVIFVIIIVSILGIFLCVWIYRDAQARGENGALWVLILLISGIIGMIIWLIVRGDKPIINPSIKGSTYRYYPTPTTPETKQPLPLGKKFCKACGGHIPPNSIFCSNCGRKLD